VTSLPTSRPLRLGLVGYGTGGRYFHAPFIAAAEGVELAGVVTGSPARREQVAVDYPGTPVYAILADMLDAGVDAVTITTPPETRFDLVIEALGRGVHVVADKPFAPDVTTARTMESAAAAAGLTLSVFHNRRLDADIQTLRTVINGGALGTLLRVESRFDLDEAGSLERGPGGGLLRDLGSHLVDQMLWLLGAVSDVYCILDWVGEGDSLTDSSFMITLTHTSGVKSVVSSTKLAHAEQRELRVYGSDGSYLSTGTDVQAKAIFAGSRPTDDLDAWGYEREDRWGILRTAESASSIPSEQGRHHDYYTAFATAVATGTPPPVPASEAISVLRVLEAARTSGLENRVVSLSA
jgi:predicted dehydrogenase